jgi:hypothetical protein
MAYVLYVVINYIINYITPFQGYIINLFNLVS